MHYQRSCSLYSQEATPHSGLTPVTGVDFAVIRVKSVLNRVLMAQE